MKSRLLPALICAVSLAVAAFAATYTRQNSRVARFQCDTVFQGGTTTALAVNCSAYIETKVLTNDADANDVIGQGQWVTVSYDLLSPALATRNFTYAGKTLNGQQFAAFMRGMTLELASEQGVQ